MNACRACGSETMIQEAAVIDHDSTSWRPLSVQVPRAAPKETSFLGLRGVQAAAVGTLTARICGACGAAELFCPEHRELWDAYSEA